jgi:porin
MKRSSTIYTKHIWAVAWMGILATAYGGRARAVESSESLLGDWGGLRPFLVAHGVDLEFGYINEFASNVRGGTTQKTADAEQFYFGGTLDLERLFAVPGAKLVFSLTDRNGDSLSVKAKLNTLLEVCWSQ